MNRPINRITSSDLIEIALICLNKRTVLIRQGNMQIHGTLSYLRNETLTLQASYDESVEVTLRVFRVMVEGSSSSTSGHFKSLDIDRIENIESNCPEIYLKPGS